MSIFTKCRLAAATMLLGAVTTVPAGASTWVIFDGMTLPIASLSDVSTDTFNYGSDVTVQLGYFGVTSAIYYRQHKWQGDAATGGYAVVGDWACKDLAQLTADNQTLKLSSMDSGRYRYDVVAVMAKDNCDVTAYKAGDLIASKVYSTNEFMVINHDKLDVTAGNIFEQNKNPTDYSGQTRRNTYYDLHLNWPTIAGTENYLVTVVKDGVEYPLDAISDSTYATQVAANGHYTVVDEYDTATKTFSPHTGFGDFQYKVQYQMAGQSSNAIANSKTVNIRPAAPRFFDNYDKSHQPELPSGVVWMLWQADSRTKYFKVFEQNITKNTIEHHILPSPSTLIQTRDDGAERYYDHWQLFKDVSLDRYRYWMQACSDKECSRASAQINETAGRSVSPVADPADYNMVTMTHLLDDNAVWVDDITHGEYVEETPAGNSFWAKFFDFNSALEGGGEPGGETSTDTAPLNEDIMNRMKVETEITPETTDLLGEQISLATGSSTFTHTDVSIPGNSGLPVQVTRTLKGGDFVFQNTREFGDWQLDIPHIHTNMLRLRHRYSSDWGEGKACSGLNQGTDVASWGKTIFAHEYYNGMTLTVPGQGGGKLLKQSIGGNNDFNNTRYYTQDNWMVKCVADSNGIEGFLATSPQGIKYTFNKYRLVMGKPIIKGHKPTPKYDAFMLVSKVEDRFGNTVNFNYAEKGGKLLSIVGNDVGSTERRIDIAYEDDKIKTVTANGRQWTYDYSTDGYLTTVTRPDNRAWQFDMAGFALQKGRTLYQQQSDDRGDMSCSLGTQTETKTYSMTHPNGVRGEFTFGHVLSGRSNVPTIYLSGDNYAVPRCSVNFSLKTKKLTGPGLDPMHWAYAYSGKVGIREGGSLSQSTFPLTSTGSDHLNWTSVTAPDGSKTVHYFDRNMKSTSEGKELFTQNFDTNGTTLLQQSQNTYATGRCLGVVDVPFDNAGSQSCYTNHTQAKQSVYASGSTTSYINNFSDFNHYGQSQITQSYNTADNNYRYTKQDLTYDSTVWMINLPTAQYISSTNGNWGTPVSEKTYYPANSIYAYLPYEEKAFGTWMKRNVQYTNGNLTKVELNTTMNNGQYQWQQFSNYKRGKAQTITLPKRYDASQSMSATVSVDNNGWVSSVTNFNGECTNYSYDTMGRATLVDPCDSKWTNTSLSFTEVDGSDIQGDVQSGMFKHVKTAGNMQSITYLDALLRPVLTKTSDTANNTHTYQRKVFNAYNKPVFEAYPATNASESQGMNHYFDGLQRPIRTTQTVTNASQYTTYLSGHKTRMTDYNGNATTTTYLAYGEPKTEQMKRIDSPEGVVTTQTLNLYGNVESIIQGGQTEYRRYDSRQRLCKVIRPETGITVLQRDTLGTVTGLVRGSSGSATGCAIGTGDNLITFTRDNVGANRTINYPDNSGDVTSTYDNQGNLTQLIAGNVTQNYTYYSGGALKSEQMLVDSKTFNLAYNYNGLKAMTQMTYPDNTVVDFAPNAFGQPTKAGGYATGAKYFPDGQVQAFTYGNQFKHGKTLNASKMPQSIKDSKWGGFSGSTYAMQFEYTFDNMGNLKSQLDKVDSSYDITSMTYDGLDRLTSANGFWGSVNIAYDTLGNITHYNFTDKGTTSYSYDAANRLTGVSGGVSRSFSYDGRGNVTANGKNTFTYNDANRMASSNVASYLYDGHGRRVKHVDANGDNYSFYDKAGRLVYREKHDGTKVNYVFLAKLQVARIEDNAGTKTTKYIHTDLLGSPVVETDSTGSVLESTRMHYRPFGQTKEAPKDEVGYTGHKFDTDIGLVYAQQRYYDSEIGRFYADDPIGYRDVHSFNRYVYGNNNPYKYIDPDGRDPRERRIKALAKAVVQEVYGEAAAQLLDARMTMASEFASPQEYKDAMATIKTVQVSSSRHPQSAQHIKDAQAAGQPSVLTIDRKGAKSNRRKSLKGVKTQKGKDRDEYPPAMFKEGGEGASVRHIDSSDNRGAGSCIGAQCRGLPDGAKVKLEVVD